MKKRKPKKTDQDNVQLAYQMISDLARINPEIEASLWVSACFSAIVDSYRNSGASVEQFCKEMDNVKEHYRKWFDRDH